MARNRSELHPCVIAAAKRLGLGTRMRVFSRGRWRWKLMLSAAEVEAAITERDRHRDAIYEAQAKVVPNAEKKAEEWARLRIADGTPPEIAIPWARRCAGLDPEAPMVGDYQLSREWKRACVTDAATQRREA